MKTIVTIFSVFFMMTVRGQGIVYGSNPSAAKYLEHKGAKIYYEVYGTGRPLLLLHGDMFGYIDEYSQYIPILSKYFKVIAVATRGHGRSSLGKETFNYPLMMEDAYGVLRAESPDSAIIIGFSGGAITGLNMAANHPEAVRSLVVMGGALNTSDYIPSSLEMLKHYDADTLERRFPGIIADRKKLMGEPGRMPALIKQLIAKWTSGDFLAPGKASDIRSRVLIIGGDRDDYFSPEAFVRVQRQIANSRLAILPATNHVGTMMNPWILDVLILPFLHVPQAP